MPSLLVCTPCSQGAEPTTGQRKVALNGRIHAVIGSCGVKPGPSRFGEQWPRRMKESIEVWRKCVGSEMDAGRREEAGCHHEGSREEESVGWRSLVSSFRQSMKNTIHLFYFCSLRRDPLRDTRNLCLPEPK